MRRSRSFSFLVLPVFALVLALAFGAAGVVRANAQAAPAMAASSEASPAEQQAARPDPAERRPEADETDKYRHSPAVQWIARTLNLSVETAATIFEYLNFAILAGSILYFILKLVPKMLRGRREALAKQLVDARTATEQADARLGGVEARLARLDDEIAEIRRQVEQDARQDEVRIKAALQEESKRIADAAGQEVEAAGAVAQRELRKFAAELAIEHATRNLALTPEIDRRLVSNFAREIGGDATSPNPTHANGDKSGNGFQGGRN